MNQSKNSRPRRFHHVPGTDPSRHQPTRDVQPQTREDVRSLRRLLGYGGATVALLLGANLIKDNVSDADTTPATPPSTTIVTAEGGDTYWDLQKAEGTNGRDIRDVVSDAIDLSGGNPELQPGDRVVLVDDPNTPAQP